MDHQSPRCAVAAGGIIPQTRAEPPHQPVSVQRQNRVAVDGRVGQARSGGAGALHAADRNAREGEVHQCAVKRGVRRVLLQRTPCLVPERLV